MKVSISSNIDKEDYERWKRSGLKMGHLIKRGLNAVEQTPEFINRIRELEETNQKLAARFQAAMKRLNDLEAQV